MSFLHRKIVVFFGSDDAKIPKCANMQMCIAGAHGDAPMIDIGRKGVSRYAHSYGKCRLIYNYTRMNTKNLWNVFRSAAAIVAFTLSTSAVFGQLLTKSDSSSTIPAEISQILKPACMTCHSDAGRDKPKSAVNFSVWDKYTPTEKMMLAASIQSEVTKKSMPPKGFLNSHPDAVLTELQINQIVQWCDSLKSKP